MKVLVNNSALMLERWDTVELIDAAGATAALDSGCVWITMDGDRRDIVLGAGQSWIVDKNGRTLVHAEAPTTLRISGPVANDAAGPGWQRALEAVGNFFERKFQRSPVPYY